MDDVLLSREDGGIAILSLNRPKTLNSISLNLTDDLHRILDEIAVDDDIRVVILTGIGRGFCSGHDFAEFGRTAESISGAVIIQERMAALVLHIASLPQPVIGAVNGPAAGGGFALALACDTRICDQKARFNAAFVRVGLLGTDMGLSYLLPRIVGLTNAVEIMLTGRFVSSEEALRLGIVTAVCPAGSLLDSARELARTIAANSPLGVRMTKRILRANLEAPSLSAAIEAENLGQVLLLQTSDHRDAVQAWLAAHQSSPARH